MKKLAIGSYAALAAALLAWGFYQAVYAAPEEQSMHEVQRIFYYHVPSAITAFFCFAVSLAGSIGFLAFRRRRMPWARAADAWALAGAEAGVVFCTVVLVTGPLWSSRAWGIWWTWDARLTTTLVLWLIYVSYLLLRRFTAAPQAPVLAAVLGIFGALDIPLVYMANRWWRTQHPAPVFGGGANAGIQNPAMLHAFVWNLLAWLVWGILLLGLRYRIARRQQELAAQQIQTALDGNWQD